MERSQRRREMITVGLFLIYAVFLSWIILFKMCLPGDVPPHLRNLNLIPFAGALVVNGKADYTEVVQNLIAFIPFGVYMSVMKPGAPFLKKLLPAACVSLAYEALQYALALGATDITDLISNTAGAAAGIGIYRILAAVCKEKTHWIINILAGTATACAVLFLSILLAANH